MKTPTVKERIQLHLFDLRHERDAYEAPLAVSQEGIARAVWINVHHVTQNVRPLMDEGLIEERMGHVKGGKRKRKVYALTERGRLGAVSLLEKVKAATVRVRDTQGSRTATIEEVVREAHGKARVLDVVRQAHHTGFVDYNSFTTEAPSDFVEMLADAPLTTDFVGRQGEIEVLTGESSPGVFVIRGVAGIGKSTLAARVCGLTRGSRSLFWHRLRAWDTPRSVLSSLAKFLAALGRPGLGAVLTRGDEAEAPSVLRDDITDVSATLVIDDAHEASPDVLSLLGFLKDIVSEAEDLRAFVLTRRKVPFYDRRDVKIENHVREMELEGLNPEDVEAFIARGQDGASGIMDNLPLLRHPLFMKLLKSASESNQALTGLSDINEFIAEVIYAELAEAERTMMMVASLYQVPVPREAFFSSAALSHDVFLSLTDRSLLLPVEAEGFEAHDTVRDFFREILTPGEREGLSGFALGQLQSLADASMREVDAVTSVRYLSNALQLSPPLEAKMRLLESLGDARELLGDLNGTLEAYQEAMGCTNERENLARLHRKKAHALEIRGHVTRALTEVEAGFALLSERDTEERAWLHLVKCHAMAGAWEWEEAREHGHAALKIFRNSEQKQGIAPACLELARVEIDSPDGEADEAKELLGEALELSGDLQDAEFRASVHIALAHLFLYKEIDAEAVSVHMQAVERAFDSLRDPHRRRAFLMLGGWFNLLLKADFEASTRYFRRAEKLGRKNHIATTVVLAKYALGLVAYYRSEIAAAKDAFEGVAADMEKLGSPGYFVEVLGRLGECYLLEGDLESFHRIAKKLRDPDLAQGVDARPVMAGVVRGLELLLERNAEDSKKAFMEAIKMGEKGGKEFEADMAYPHFMYGVALRAMGDEVAAASHLSHSKKLLQAYQRKAEIDVFKERGDDLLQALRPSFVER